MSMYYIGDLAFDGMYLEHHGTKGQKWGVRRYQNPDGSLTALGYQHYYGYARENRKKYIKNTSKAYRELGYNRRESKKLAEERLSKTEKHLDEKRKEIEEVNAKFNKGMEDAERAYYENKDGSTAEFMKKAFDKIRSDDRLGLKDASDEDIEWFMNNSDLGDYDPVEMYKKEYAKEKMSDVTKKMKELNESFRKDVDDLLVRFVNNDMYHLLKIEEDQKAEAKAKLQSEQGNKLAAYVKQNAKAKSKDDMISWKDFDSLAKSLNVRYDKLDEVFESLKSVYNYINKEGGSMSKLEIRNLDHSLKKAGINIPASYFVDVLYED